MSVLQDYYRTQAETIIRHLARRNMEGYYCETSGEAVKKALSFLPENALVSFGGSETLVQSGMLDALRAGNFELIDRSLAKDAAERKELFRKSFFADYYFMSTNAITLDGQLVNVDGNGNRAAALVYGPDHVILLVGMNKVAKNVEEAVSRVHSIAAPLNAFRLNSDTPCHKTGVCADCLAKDCLCAHTVITRYNRFPERVKVILIGESLGF